MARTMHEPEAEESAAAAPQQCAGGAVQERGQESGCCRQLGVEARARQRAGMGSDAAGSDGVRSGWHRRFWP